MVIHSGSRNLGHQVASYYQKIAIEMCSGRREYFEERDKLIEDYRAKGKNKDISKALKKLKRNYPKHKPRIPRDLCYLSGTYVDKYLHDMKIAQEYATINRKVMADIILNTLLDKSLDDYPHFETIHNYINFEDNMIRKGAVSAHKDELLIIPINMRDGSILARGKGNPDWNYSSPHGAGRLYSRNEARKAHNMEDFVNSMKDVYTTSVNRRTLDENPEAYRQMEDILKHIDPTAEVVDIIKPIYNFKDSN